MLTEPQKKHFTTFGYLALRQVFDATEVREIRRASDAILRRNRNGKPFSGIRRQAMIPFFEYSPVLMSLMEDDRIFELGTDLLGPGFLLNATEGNLHVGDTQWHGGGPETEPVAHIKIAFYLEEATANHGALRLIPGSNDPEYRRQLLPLKTEADDLGRKPFGVTGSEVPCHIVETKPGDLVIFPETTWHAVFGGHSGRSQHAISFAANPTTELETNYLRQLYKKFKFSLHPAPELTSTTRPRLKGLVEPLIKLGFGPPTPTPTFA